MHDEDLVFSRNASVVRAGATISFDFFLRAPHPLPRLSCEERTRMSSKARSAPTAQPAATEPASWQAQKSASTRNQILEAALACFVELGYSSTTTTAIAEHAGVSRGAMLHHFPSKLDVVRAAVEYLHEKRLRGFRKAIARMPANTDRVHHCVEAYWRQVRHPMFVAFFELTVAARTDRELAQILNPAQEAFDREWYNTAVELFPEWQETGANFDLALDLSHHLIEGMAVNLMNRDLGERDRRLLRWLEERLRELGEKPRAAKRAARST
jgi:AcrR family transcriptional regulator